ncbi:flavin monoamine oxidase family protein [Effusibacillus lacus]|uniref:Amine oxidase domain-containing protein n=1 Tax=Effusibacillus lacus TaxID=1348429 RepID=A0A292YSC0_9BACL|nr:NAD(P)/FAD-dependent oxidoreductase [Effusibacillus lacus]TCS76263.1 protoporphyrinogen oxidase [Effusibacillus lacus]GAX91811.1 hypothetical protein EFBL_3502 [Effusibacillus lacus]
MLDAVIVGGGLAGLTAARTLQAAGARLLVLEKENRLGGRLWTHPGTDTKQKPHELGAQFFSRHFQAVWQLARDLDVPLLPVPFQLQMRIGDEWKQARYDSWRILFALPGVPWHVRHQLIKLLRDAGNRNFPDRDLAEYASRYHSSIKEYVVAPFYQTLFFSKLQGGSAKHFLSHFGSPRSQRIYRPAGGMSQLVDKLAEGVPVQTGSEVKQILPDQDWIHIRFDTKQGERELRARYALVSIPGDQVTKIVDMESLNPDDLQLLQQVRYSGTAVVTVSLKHSCGWCGFGFSVPPKYSCVLAGGVFYDRQFLCGMLTDDAYEKWRYQSDDRIKDFAVTELCKLFSLNKSHIMEVNLFRWDSAIPKFIPGMADSFRQLYGKGIAGGRLFLAGDYLQLGCTEGAIRSGLEAANLMRKLLGTKG